MPKFLFQACLLISDFQVEVVSVEFLLCPNRPFPIWEQLGCWESIALRQEKRIDPYQKGLAVCISVHCRNIQDFMIAAVRILLLS